MILLLAVVAGLIAALARAYWGHRQLQSLSLRYTGLVLLAFIPQLIAFQLPQTSAKFPDDGARIALVVTQALLIVFAWYNRKAQGFYALGIGLLMNFTVIVLNGGWMPISAHTVEKLAGGTGMWKVGERLGYTKDIILPIEQIRLWWLADQFTLPGWIPYRVAFSLGDIIIGIGAFWLLWSLSGPIKQQQEEQHERNELLLNETHRSRNI